MIPFHSRHNQVYPVFWNGRRAVEKHFRSFRDWEQESRMYRELSGVLPCPELLHTEPGALVTAYCPRPVLLRELERQSRDGFCAAPWEALAAWLRLCHSRFGCLPAEGVLRDFLWDRDRGYVIALDFEEFRPISLSRCGAMAAASLLEGAPGNPSAGRRAAALLAERLLAAEREIAFFREELRSAGRTGCCVPVSGIVLAGGASRRMGRGKAEISLGGKPLLLWQIEKLRALGVQEILLSGAGCPRLPGTRVIADEYPGRGPLGGLHACLRAAESPRALVLGVDVPLVPVQALSSLCRVHAGGVTVLRHGTKQEPLIGVYDRGLAGRIAELIRDGGAPVRALGERAPWSLWDYLGPEELLLNCNTPQDMETAESAAERYGRFRPEAGEDSEPAERAAQNIIYSDNLNIFPEV